MNSCELNNHIISEDDIGDGAAKFDSSNPTGTNLEISEFSDQFSISGKL